jgi:hypothetical protein
VSGGRLERTSMWSMPQGQFYRKRNPVREFKSHSEKEKYKIARKLQARFEDLTWSQSGSTRCYMLRTSMVKR